MANRFPCCIPCQDSLPLTRELTGKTLLRLNCHSTSNSVDLVLAKRITHHWLTPPADRACGRSLAQVFQNPRFSAARAFWGSRSPAARSNPVRSHQSHPVILMLQIS
eukprot:scaffold10070_cov103-Phaeocystis_antarctica.AAC.5